MKKQTYLAPEITVVDLAEKVNTLAPISSDAEGSAVLLSWLVD